ncbi:hypothetical protein [Pelagicoccus mobilis]|uniref:Porin n=1 Tax=Pelagicoccus mobilis TaxID=415221 RepID=A0A934VPK3_9BACT|nr:hypothetical protein [Pelagicoccus mobilis]MBK1875618.1 hypothetical protein [Pelagicoccus mobilis]
MLPHIKEAKRGLAHATLLCLFCTCGLSQTLSVGGFISTGYLESSHYNYLANTEEGTTDFVEAALNASWTPANRTTLNGQAFLFELGPYGNYEPFIDYLFVEYSYSKEFGIRAGRIKRELGLYTHIQDIDISRTSIILPHGVYDPRYRAFSASLDGAAIYGTFGLPGRQRLTYNLYGGHVNIDPEGGLAGFTLTATSRLTIDNHIETIDSNTNFGAQFWYSPGIEGLRLGYGRSEYYDVDIVSHGTFPSNIPDPNLAGLEFISKAIDTSFALDQFSIEYYVGNWNFAAEYHSSTADITLEQSIGGISIPSRGRNPDFRAWYLQGSRRFGPFEIGLTYAEEPNNWEPEFDTVNASHQKDRQISLRYDATDNWTLKLEAHSIRGTRRLFNQHGQNPVLGQDSWTLWAAKSTITF